MSVQVSMPKQNTSIGRRLLGMAAPIVGGLVGGPAGAAAGSIIGNKIAGGNSQDALLGGIESAASYKANNQIDEAKPQSKLEFDLNSGMSPQSLESNGIQRRMAALNQDPQYVINDGLNALAMFPKDHPFRQEFTAPLVQATMISRRA